jgi:multisubunit Na+/H+ antiporter MnhB subunit
MVIWVLVNGGETGRSMSFYPIPWKELRHFFETFSVWLLPGRVPALFGFLIWITIIIWTLWTYLTVRLTSMKDLTITHVLFQYRIIRASFVFSLIYICFVICCRLFLDPSILFDLRILSPLFPAIMTIIVCAAWRWFRKNEGGFQIFVAIGVIACIIVMFQVRLYSQLKRNPGTSYTNAFNQLSQSNVLRENSDLLIEKSVVTNWQAMSFLYFKKRHCPIPYFPANTTKAEIEAYQLHLKKYLKQKLPEDSLLLIFRKKPNTIKTSIKTLDQLIPGQRISSDEIVALYEVNL